MNKDIHERSMYEFLETYLILGCSFLGLFVCFITDYAYSLESKLDLFVFIFFVFAIPTLIQSLIEKINNLDPMKDAEEYKANFHIKKDYLHPIYFYIHSCMTIVMSIGFGVLMASLLLYLKD